jgi:hypothetical protein
MPIQTILTRSLKPAERPAAHKIGIVIAVSGRHVRDLMQNPIPSNVHLSEGYVVEVGGKFVSEYGTFTAALKAGLELKNKNSQVQVKVYDAAERT